MRVFATPSGKERNIWHAFNEGAKFPYQRTRQLCGVIDYLQDRDTYKEDGEVTCKSCLRQLAIQERKRKENEPS